MIEEHTVFILGAGASKPYGFPLGHELRARILSSLENSGSGPFKQLMACGHTADDIKSFHNELNDALHNTIDDFLFDRPSLRVIGSQAISIVLATCEEHKNLFPKRDWYPDLFKLLDFKFGNQLLDGILTLNYDRSLEHYLSKTVSVSYEGQTKVQAEARLSQFPIYHLHGMLGEYPIKSYKPEIQTDTIMAIADNLRITSDSDLDKSPNYLAAKQLCDKAKTVVFLGFGYHDRVISRLDLYEPKSTRKLLGTAYGLSHKRIQEVKDMFKGQIDLGSDGFPISQYLETVLMQ